MSVVDDLLDAYAPWLTPDAEDYLTVLGQMFAEVEALAFDVLDTDGNVLHDGWTILFDVVRCRTQDLQYLAMVIGERLPVGISDPDAREWIEDAPNSRRGSIMSIVRAAQRNLQGARVVSIKERLGPSGADDDWLTVVTFTDETPDPGALETDLRENVIPGDIELNYEVLAGETWADVHTNYATWAAVNSHYANWGEVAADRVGYSSYTRPRR